jgi:hypothetical protein
VNLVVHYAWLEIRFFVQTFDEDLSRNKDPNQDIQAVRHLLDEDKEKEELSC